MSEDFVYVPVPTRWVEDIYQRLGELAATGPDAGGVKVPDTLDESLVGRMFAESQEKHRKLMLFLAEHPNQWFTTPQLASDLGLDSPRQLAGMLGAFGRRSKHRYGGRTPWESAWDPNQEVSRHSMTDEIAAAVLAAAEAHEAAR